MLLSCEVLSHFCDLLRLYWTCKQSLKKAIIFFVNVAHQNYEHFKILQPQFVRFLMFSQPNKILFYYCLHSVSYQKPYWENDGSIFGPSILLTRPRPNGNFINWLPIFFKLRCGVASIFCFLLSFHSNVSKLCNQVRSLSLFRWRTLTLLNI